VLRSSNDNVTIFVSRAPTDDSTLVEDVEQQKRSKTVKVTDFKFNAHVFKDSTDVAPKLFFLKWA